jgi:hypothetical protein
MPLKGIYVLIGLQGQKGLLLLDRATIVRLTIRKNKKSGRSMTKMVIVSDAIQQLS